MRLVIVSSALLAVGSLCGLPAWAQQAPAEGSDRPLSAVFGPKEQLGAWWAPPLPDLKDRMQAVHIALLPSNKVLIVNGSSNRNRFEDGAVRDGISPLDYPAVNNTSLFDPTASPALSGMTRIASPPSPIGDAASAVPNDLFCSGHLQLADGNMLFAGGTRTYYPGEKFLGSRMTNFFDWKSETWKPGAPLTDGHWYPSLIPLGDGRIFVISGLSSNFFSNSSWVEIYDPSAAIGSQWNSVDVRLYPNSPFNTPVKATRPLPMTGSHGMGMQAALTPDAPVTGAMAGLDDMDHYPRIAPLPDGRFLITGDGSGGGNVNSTHTYIMKIGPRPAPGEKTTISFELGPERSGYRKTFGTAFMDPNGVPGSYMLVAGLAGSGDINIGPGDPPPDPRINTVGSAERYTPPSLRHPAGSWATYPDFLGDRPTDRREMLVGVLLPTRQVLLMGGGNYGTSAPVFSPLLLTPDKKAASGYLVKTMNPAQQPRLYHTSSLLLPDGRVCLAGGNAARAVRDAKTEEVRLDSIRTPDGTWTFAPKGSNFIAAEIYQAEIFYPPYLLIEGPRPVISKAPEKVSYGKSATMSVTDATAGASVVMIKLGSMTHAWDMGQRLAAIPFTQSAPTGNVTVRMTAPVNRTLYPPGYYMVFYVNGKGKPSKAAILQLGQSADQKHPAG